MSKKEKQQEQPETEETELTVEDSKTETPPEAAPEVPKAPEVNWEENTKPSTTPTCGLSQSLTISASAPPRKRISPMATAKPMPSRSSFPSMTIWSGL